MSQWRPSPGGDAFWVNECIDVLKGNSQAEIRRLHALTVHSLDVEFEELRDRILAGLHKEEPDKAKLHEIYPCASRGGGRTLSGMPQSQPCGDNEVPTPMAILPALAPARAAKEDLLGTASGALPTAGRDLISVLEDQESADAKAVNKFRQSQLAPFCAVPNGPTSDGRLTGKTVRHKPFKATVYSAKTEAASDADANGTGSAGFAYRLRQMNGTNNNKLSSRYSVSTGESRASTGVDSSDGQGAEGPVAGRTRNRQTLAARLELVEQAKQAQRRSGEDKKAKQLLQIDASASLASGFPSMRRIVHSIAFNIASGIIIMAGAVFTGIQVNIAVESSFKQKRSITEGAVWVVCEWIILSLFTVEIVMRVLGHGLEYVRMRGEWGWNLFDTMILVICIVQQAMESFSSMPFLRLVRIVRVLRVLKVLHLIHFFKRLGKMMFSVLASMNALAPAVVLLALVMYVFSISLLQGIRLWLDSQDGERQWPEALEARFGNLGRAMKTLFMSSTGGISWVECIDALSVMDNYYDEFYFFYVTFVNICVLNIVTGIFVDTVHQMYTPEREELVEQERDARARAAANLMHLFEEADEDQSGYITWAEFEAFLSIEQVRTYFQSLELDVTHVREVFDLMDQDESGAVGVDEFVQGFLEMKGAAKGVDVTVIKHQMIKLSHQILRLQSDMIAELGSLKDSTVEVLEKVAMDLKPDFVGVY